MSELLSTEEIVQMNDYLREHPPLARPPADLPYFDVRRIAATLLHLSAEVERLKRPRTGRPSRDPGDKHVVIAYVED